MYFPIWGNNFVHLIGPVSLRKQRNRLPRASRVIIRIFVRFELFFCKRKIISSLFKCIFVFYINKNVFM